MSILKKKGKERIHLNCFDEQHVANNAVNTAFHNLRGQREPGLNDRKSMHGWFCTEKSIG